VLDAAVELGGYDSSSALAGKGSASTWKVDFTMGNTVFPVVSMPYYLARVMYKVAVTLTQPMARVYYRRSASPRVKVVQSGW
jgi:hypothetical protein